MGGSCSVFYAPQEGLGRHQGSALPQALKLSPHPLEVEMNKPEVLAFPRRHLS